MNAPFMSSFGEEGGLQFCIMSFWSVFDFNLVPFYCLRLAKREAYAYLSIFHSVLYLILIRSPFTVFNRRRRRLILQHVSVSFLSVFLEFGAPTLSSCCLRFVKREAYASSYVVLVNFDLSLVPLSCQSFVKREAYTCTLYAILDAILQLI